MNYAETRAFKTLLERITALENQIADFVGRQEVLEQELLIIRDVLKRK